MEENIFKYLEFSLPTHNCVTIPDLGGFIINPEPARILASSEIIPPGKSIVFNPELTHDDGILTSLLSKTDNISYTTANKRLRDLVILWKNKLKDGKDIPCGNLGFLSMNEDGFVLFTQNRDWNIPFLFGLTPTAIKKVNEMKRLSIKTKRSQSYKYAIGGIAATVAAITLLMTPVSIKDVSYSTQKADFISTISGSLTQKTTPAFLDVSTSENISTESPKENNIVPLRTYYIIIGGEEDEARARKLLEKFRKDGFSSANIVQSADRYRIYISSFEDKTEAEGFLSTFRQENPKFETAWLYSHRNY